MGNTEHYTILDLFTKQVEQMPDAIAIEHIDRQITYKELHDKSRNLARFIVENDPNSQFIGVSATKSMDMVLGLLAIIMANKAYVPLDTAYPKERLQQMVGDSGIKSIVCNQAENDIFDGLGLHPLSTDNEYPPAPTNSLHQGLPNELVALLYTSGSTGVPKGVCMTKAGLDNFVDYQLTHSIAAPGVKNLQFCHLSFDASFQEIFVSLSSGGTLYIINDDIRLDAAKLLDYIDKKGINRIFLPYVAVQYLAETASIKDHYPSELKEITTGGELLKITPQIRNFYSKLQGGTLVNVYGPTETSIWVTETRLSGDPYQWPDIPTIGAAIDHAHVFILDGWLREVEDGASGEICIGGIPVSAGYLNRPALTAERYLDWESPQNGSLRLYRTGDLGRYLPSKEIEFLGRLDNQVKIRGNRVELGEIEVVLAQLPGISQCAVVAREDIPGQKRLVAYLIPMQSQEKDTTRLRALLEEKLPDYMVPAAFVWMDEFPKTTSGKVDRKALPKPETSRPPLGILYQKPTSEIEKKVVAIWEELLLINKIGIHDNFFELGGNSLLAQKTIALLAQRHAIDLAITKLYQHATAAKIAEYLENGGSKKNRTRDYKKRDKEPGSNRAIAIIGMSGRFPGADTIEELWALLKEGRETTKFFSDAELDASIPETEKTDPDYVKARGVINHAEWFDAELFGISPVMAGLMDPQQRIFLEVCRELLESTGYLSTSYEGSVGVYAGCGNNTYYINNLLSNPDEIAKIGDFQVMVANEKDYISTRTAYQLNLKGPAVSVNSACSTSLLAVAQAVNALRNGQCDVAIAGGISIKVPVNSGHLYEEGAMLSKDGHTRTFSDDANGTVFSDGASVVLLKDLESAEKDEDTIYAVIKGVGLSNDGGGKGSFTAPSTTGQAEAIAMALADADVEPSTITYVETHGTATPLGDPIEIEGLKLAFGEQTTNQFCRIGSIKSNMGHLTHAAGAAGMIKTALALHHKTIPASINYSKPNPAIDFPNSPFVVNDKLTPWESEQKRRAGVSSFGVGGTNVHVILEEYDKPSPILEDHAQALTLISWSARSEDSLTNYAEKLSGFIIQHPEVSIEDIAHTLRVSRPDLSWRAHITASDRGDLLNKLETKAWQTSMLQEGNDQVAFMFPGQGAQYVNMGLQLYQHEAVYRQAIDECAELLSKEMGADIREVIYSTENAEKAAETLRNTYYTQPALFITEYALAKLWMSRGIQPTAFIGHSVGEFVAAHLSGVFSLADALKLVASRGRLISKLAGGSMLSVRASVERLTPTLPATISVAAVNAPNLCVVAGESDAIAEYAQHVDKQGIITRLLHTSHAFHSDMMTPMLNDFKAVVTEIKLHVPTIPIASTVTGQWMKDGEATDPAYWVQHVKATVRFSEALQFLHRELDAVMLEVGPGNVMFTLAKQHGGGIASKAIGGLDASGKGLDEYRSLYLTMGKLWSNGISPDWNPPNDKPMRGIITGLPTYAYDRSYHWILPKQVFPHSENGQNHLQQLQFSSIEETNPIIEPLMNSNMMRKDLLIAKVKKLLEDASGIDIVGASNHSNFIEIGLDSLLLTQIAQSLKKEFGLPITFRKLNEEYYNLDLLGSYLDGNLPKDAYQPQQAEAQQAPSPIAAIQAHPILANHQHDAISLISQQISLLSRQVALIQGVQQPLPSAQVAPHPNVQRNGATIAAVPEPELAPEEAIELKKPFGATARIEKQSSELNEKQQAYLNNFIESYTQKTKGSKAYTQKHRAHMADPRVVTGFKPVTKEMVYSLVMNKSKGSRLWDIDGNAYIDALNGFGSNLLGNQPEVITKALIEQIEDGYEIGPQHEKAGEVCELICEFTKFDRAALCNTGSEAILGAMRIARTVTGRSLIVAFTNSYHGIIDEVIVRGTKKLKTFPAASGIQPEAVQNMLILDYGTPESLQIIRERAHELAAVLVEPVQSRRPEFQPVEFLKELRQVTADADCALIFDEVITGFRFHPQGAQGLFGITADLATYGKVAGAGMSIGIIAGKKAFMDALDGGFWQYGDDSVPEMGVTYFAGTFVRHPLTLATTKASLLYLKAQGPRLQENLNENTSRLANALNAICDRYKAPIYIAQFASLWKIKYKEEYPFSELLFSAMRHKGIHILDGFPCFLTTAHTQADIDEIILAFEESVVELLEAGFIPSRHLDISIASDKTFSNNVMAPLPNARLGKDESGNPAWFIEDEKNPGKYLHVALH